MKLNFYKYQGTGNDFIIIDNREHVFDPNNTKLINHLCDRRFGIGADGLMLLESTSGFDFKMVYFNADGSESTMCGNGGRCLVKFAYDKGVIGAETNFLAIDGSHKALVVKDKVSLKMIDVNTIEAEVDTCFLNTGSPHVVKFVDEINDYPVFDQGKAIRYSPKYLPGGTNVNFVEKAGENAIFVRTYERGVEDETFSCGTGVTAAALAASQRGFKSPVAIKTLGGDLEVSFEVISSGFEEIYLIGPALKVFEGQIEI